MKIAFYGSSLLSSYWNGAATYYRGMLRALAALGYDITFYEPDVYDRQAHRDIEPPDWCRVVVYDGTVDGAEGGGAEAAEADIVVKASGVGYRGRSAAGRGHGRRPAGRDAHLLGRRRAGDAGRAARRAGSSAAPRPARARPGADLWRRRPVVAAYAALGARDCVPIYNALDPETHHPVAARAALRGRPRLPRQPPARPRGAGRGVLPRARPPRCPDARFLLGGSGWADKPMPANVRATRPCADARPQRLQRDAAWC